MRNHIILLALSGLLAISCKPTPRTAVGAPSHKDSEQPAAAESPAEPAAAPEQQPAPELEAPGVLEVAATRQDYNRLRPWEKEKAGGFRCKGVYLGEGRVLTVGRAARAATYIELSLPDHSRTVPARVLKYDDALDLALLTVEHAEDASIFSNLPVHEVGEPLTPGGSAELRALVQGITPVRVGVEVEGVDEDSDLPLLDMRSEKPLPSGTEPGMPILKDGRVVALVASVAAREQSLTCINAEFIHRFLDESTAAGNDVPVMGVVFSRLDDPVFSKYLKLNPEQGGIYVSDVLPSGSAYAAGVRAGDVLTSIAGLPLDKQGRGVHPLYGLISAQQLIRSLKPVGQQLRLGISRGGEQLEMDVALNRDAVEKNLLGVDKPGHAPRYIMWGGMLFQPLTQTYLDTLRSRAGSLPLPLLQLKERLHALSEEGRHELVGLTLVIPTAATLGYDGLGFCLVEKVNGKTVHSFAEFAELLDAPTEDGLVELSLNRAPYSIYLDRQAVEAANDVIRRRIIPRLRQMGETP